MCRLFLSFTARGFAVACFFTRDGPERDPIPCLSRDDCSDVTHTQAVPGWLSRNTAPYSIAPRAAALASLGNAGLGFDAPCCLNISALTTIYSQIRQVLFLPEASDYIAPNAQASLDLAVSQSTSPFVLGLRDAAKQHSVAVHVGIHHPIDDGPGLVSRKMLNRALYIAADGTIHDSATYDKLHVFDYGSLKESATVQPGARLTPPFDSPVGRIGSLICFDVRFAEPAIALAQPGPKSRWANRPAQILTYPSAFTLRTGEAHWETLLRCRAIETQSWVVAAAQVGKHNDKRASYGRSMVVDPWGRVVVRLGGADAEGNADDGAVEEIGFAKVDLDELERVRREMPLQRRM